MKESPWKAMQRRSVTTTSSNIPAAPTSSANRVTSTANALHNSSNPMRKQVSFNGTGNTSTPNPLFTSHSMSSNAISASSSNGDIGGANPMMQRPAKRMSVREAIIESNRRPSANAIPVTVNPLQSQKSSSAINATPSSHRSDNNLQAVRELQSLLAEEAQKQERLKMQIMMMNNELSERDEQIIALKRSEEQFRLKLIERENMYKQDNIVRLQLGKRLEQLLMDKEEAYEQIELLKV